MKTPLLTSLKTPWFYRYISLVAGLSGASLLVGLVGVTRVSVGSGVGFLATGVVLFYVADVVYSYQRKELEMLRELAEDQQVTLQEYMSMTKGLLEQVRLMRARLARAEDASRVRPE